MRKENEEKEGKENMKRIYKANINRIWQDKFSCAGS